MDKRVAQYLRLDSWLFQTTVRRRREALEEEAAVRKARPPSEKEPGPGKSSKAKARLTSVCGKGVAVGVVVVEQDIAAVVVDSSAQNAANEGRLEMERWRRKFEHSSLTPRKRDHDPPSSAH